MKKEEKTTLLPAERKKKEICFQKKQHNIHKQAQDSILIVQRFHICANTHIYILHTRYFIKLRCI